MPDEKTISDLITAEQISASDLIETSIPNAMTASGRVSRKHTLGVIADFFLKTLQFLNLNTTAKTICGAINELANAGTGSLNGLNDVDITTPTIGQGLKYDSAYQSWKNVDVRYSLKDVIIYATKSANATTVDIEVMIGNTTVYSKTVTMQSKWGDFANIADSFLVNNEFNAISMYGDGSSSDTNTDWLHVTLNGTTYDFGHTVSNPSSALSVYANSKVRAEATAQHSYSSTEQVVGTYIDGRPIYEMTFSSFIMPNETYVDLAFTNITNLAAILSLEGLFDMAIPFTLNGAIYGTTHFFVESLNQYNAYGYIDSSGVRVRRTSSSEYSSMPSVYLTIRYLKTAS